MKTVNQNGFTLIEVMISVMVIGILVTMGVLKGSVYVSEAKATVCKANRVQIERMYRSHLINVDRVHEDTEFEKFIDKQGRICPQGGSLSYSEDSIVCTIHDEVTLEEVPVL